MGQVPHSTPYLIIGSGRLSRHLRHYFRLESIPFRHWDRAGATPVEEALAGCRSVLLLISDDAIPGFLERHARAHPARWIHCSGSLSSELADCAHPLMLFGDELYDRAVYRAMPFVCERGRRQLPELLPELANPHAAVAPEQKPLYHALCALGGNFTTLLWRKVLDDAEARLGLPRELFHPYLEQVVRNLERGDGELTGPLARGDEGTIARNLEALAGDPYRGVYEAFVAAYRAQRPSRSP